MIKPIVTSVTKVVSHQDMKKIGEEFRRIVGASVLGKESKETFRPVSFLKKDKDLMVLEKLKNEAVKVGHLIKANNFKPSKFTTPRGMMRSWTIFNAATFKPIYIPLDRR